MRILLWHGYLLGGTGSNVYSRALAREWSRGGHEVVVVSQERAPEQYDLGGAQAVAVDLLRARTRPTSARRAARARRETRPGAARCRRRAGARRRRLVDPCGPLRASPRLKI